MLSSCKMRPNFAACCSAPWPTPLSKLLRIRNILARKLASSGSFTWGQNLLFHPHIHCVVPSGGLAAGSTHWIRGSQRFFLPEKVLKKVFRGKFVDGLEQLLLKNVCALPA